MYNINTGKVVDDNDEEKRSRRRSMRRRRRKRWVVRAQTLHGKPTGPRGKRVEYEQWCRALTRNAAGADRDGTINRYLMLTTTCFPQTWMVLVSELMWKGERMGGRNEVEGRT